MLFEICPPQKTYSKGMCETQDKRSETIIRKPKTAKEKKKKKKKKMTELGKTTIYSGFQKTFP